MISLNLYKVVNQSKVSLITYHSDANICVVLGDARDPLMGAYVTRCARQNFFLLILIDSYVKMKLECC